MKSIHDADRPFGAVNTNYLRKHFTRKELDNNAKEVAEATKNTQKNNCVGCYSSLAGENPPALQRRLKQ